MAITKLSRLLPNNNQMLHQLYRRTIRPKTLESTKIYITWCEIIPRTSNRSETKLDLETEAREKCSRLEQGLWKIPSCSRLVRPFSNQVKITSKITSLHCQTQIFLKQQAVKWIYCRIQTKTKLLGAFLENHYRAFKLQNAQTFWKTTEVSCLNLIMRQLKRKFKEMWMEKWTSKLWMRMAKHLNLRRVTLRRATWITMLSSHMICK